MNLIVQFVSLVGAGLVLGAYVALQQRWWTSTGSGYLWFNFIGALALTVVAVLDQRIGFVILEGVWAAVSLVAIARRQRGAMAPET
jgi:hypothetical protein